jgi:hypothetical protein
MIHCLEEKKMSFQKSVLTVAVATALGVSPVVQADSITATWTGAYSLLAPNGDLILDNDSSTCIPGAIVVCTRFAISGTLTFDTATGTGAGTITPFSFLGGGPKTYTGLSFQSVGGGLVLGNMMWDWNGTFGVPVSVVLDAAGFFGALASGVTGGQPITGGATPASDNGESFFASGAVLATTTWNTTDIGTVQLGDNPSGTLPLLADAKSIGGSPMRVGPTLTFNDNFDILSVQITACTDTDGGVCGAPPAVPIPATAWLFGSGLIGLGAMVRRRKR